MGHREGKSLGKMVMGTSQFALPIGVTAKGKLSFEKQQRLVGPRCQVEQLFPKFLYNLKRCNLGIKAA